MGQRAAKLHHPARSEAARRSSDSRMVNALIKRERLGPCWAADVQGHDCPVCMETYARLNHTACCHQDVCTECFITIVADERSARCPYCTAQPLEVYLPRRSTAAAAPRASLGARREAAAPHPQQPQLPATPASALQQAWQHAAAEASLEGRCPSAGGPRLAASSAFFCSAATAPAVPPPSECSSCGEHKASAPVTLLPGRSSLLALAEAAAAAHRRQPGAVVAMVLSQQPPHRPGCASGPRSGGSSGSSIGGSAAPDEGAAAAAPPPGGGPAVLLHPDGTGQLVLLTTEHARRAAEAAMQQAAAAQERHAAELAAAAATYAPPAPPDDERVRAAIARSDAALRRQAPAGAPHPAAGGDWLQRLRAADAALQSTVARRDAQRFGSEQPPAGP